MPCAQDDVLAGTKSQRVLSAPVEGPRRRRSAPVGPKPKSTAIDTSCATAWAPGRSLSPTLVPPYPTRSWRPTSWSVESSGSSC